MERYLAALRREIEVRAPVAQGREVETVYFGGGTPTLYPVDDLAGVLEWLRQHFALVSERAAVPARTPEEPPLREGTPRKPALPEITCEANPGTVDEAYLCALRQAGVNRLSLGVQSFRDEELRLLGRIHSADQAGAAVAAARAGGFDNLSLDLIAGLPGQSLAAWEYNQQEALALAPEHLSSYGLSLPPGTPLAAAVERCELTPMDEDLSAALWLRTHEVLTASRRSLATRDSRLPTSITRSPTSPSPATGAATT